MLGRIVLLKEAWFKTVFRKPGFNLEKNFELT